MWLPFLALDSYVAFEYRDAVSPLVNGYGLYGLVVDPHRGVVEDVEDQYCVRCYLEFKVAPVCNIGMHHGPLLNPNRPFAKPKNIDSLNGFGIYRLLDEDTSRIQVFLIPARANQLNRRKPGKSALLNHSFEVIEERRGIFREHLLEMILTYPGRMSLPRQCFDDVHNRSKYTQKKSINQITNSSLKFVDNKTTILGMLKMLTAAANVGRLRIVSGNPATGASGKPELAFIVNIVQGANAETQGTNGLQIFHLTNDYIRVIPSSSVAMAWPTLQTLTDEAIITKLHSTASGDWGGLGVTMEWAGSGGSTMKYLTVTDFTRNTFSNGAIGDIAYGEMFTFTSAVDATNGPGSALVGYAVKISALSVKYVGTSTSINTYKRSYLYTYQSTGIYNTNWSIVGTPTGIEASVYEFTYGEGANNVPTNDLKLVKVADIFRMVFSTPYQADYVQLDFIRSQDNDKTDQYVFVCPSVDTGATLGGTLQRIAVDATTGAVVLTGVGIAMVGQAAQKVMVTNFVAPTNAVIQNLSAGQGLIIYALANATGLPSGVTGTAFYGHCIKNTLTNSYTYLLQTADGSRTFSGSTNGTTTTWTELGGGSGGTEQLFVGDIALANAAPETFNLGGEVSDGDRLMIVYNFISSDHTMIGSKQGRSIIWVSTSGTEDLTIEALNYNTLGGVTGLVNFNLMLSASGSVLTMEATGDVDTVIEAFHVVGIYRLSKAL